MSVNFVGLNSNLDSGALIQQLIAVETQAKIRPLEQKRFDLSIERNALSSIETNVTDLKNVLDIKDIGNSNEPLFPNAVSSSDSSDEFVTITAGSDAVTQNFDIAVSQLASPTIKKSTSPLSTGLTGTTTINNAGLKNNVTMKDGTLTINGETQTYTVDPATDDIDSMISFLDSFTGVSASLVNNQVQLSGITNIGSSGDTSNIVFALGLDNAQVSSGTITGLQNLDAAKTSSTLSALGITGTNIKINGEDITFDPATDTISTLVNKINTTPNAKATAFYDSLNGEFSLTNSETGSLSITTSSSDSNVLTQLSLTGETLGNNAEFTISTINGGATLVSNSNKVTGIIDDLTFDLSKVTTGTGDGPVTVNITKDTSAYSSRVENYLDEIGSILSSLSQTDNSLTRRLSSNIRNRMGTFFSGATDTYRSGVELGIETSLDGEGNFLGYTLDKTAFEEALASNPEAVNTVLFGKTGTDIAALSDGSSGLFVGLSDLLDTYVDPNVPTNGILRTINESLGSRIDSVEDQIDRAETRIEALELSLTREFSQLDVITADFQRQQAAVQSLF